MFVWRSILMNSVYIEYSFKKDVAFRSRVFFAFLVAVCVLLGFYSLFVTILVPVFIAAIALTYFYKRSLKCEYEYILLDDDLAIDRIINKAKRKKMARYDLSKIIDFSSVDEDFYKRYQDKRVKSKKYFSRLNEDDIYALVFNNGNNYECLYIQADEALKQAIASRHPHNLHL